MATEITETVRHTLTATENVWQITLATSPQGVTGEAGSSFTWRGEWATSTAYAVNDIVRGGGSYGWTYICILAHDSDSSNAAESGVDTDTYWEIFAEADTRTSRYSTGSVFTSSDTVGTDDLWKKCYVSMSGDVTLELTDGLLDGDQVAFIVFNPNRYRFTLTNPSAVELNYSNASYIVAEMIFSTSSSEWESLSFYDMPLKEKGDLMVGIGSNERVHLPVGADALALVADSTEDTGVKWGGMNQELFTYSDVVFKGLVSNGERAVQLHVATSTTVIADGDDYEVLLCDGTFTVTLPDVTDFPAGRLYTIKNEGVGAITVSAPDDLIDGATTYDLGTQYDVVRVIGDGSTWHII